MSARAPCNKQCHKEHKYYQDKLYNVFKICECAKESEHTIKPKTYITLKGTSSMWFWREQILTRRFQAAQKEFVRQYIRQRKLPLAQALHRRVKALGTCKLSVLNSELLQRIFVLSVDSKLLQHIYALLANRA